MSASASTSASASAARIDAPPQPSSSVLAPTYSGITFPHPSRAAPAASLGAGFFNNNNSGESSSSSSSSRTHDSRHDNHNRQSFLSDVAPPPYAAEAAIPLPKYTLHAPEPVTLAMYLFKFGFLFPPFWFFGAIILLSPLREPPAAAASDDDEESSIPAWMPEKTEEERRKIIEDIRRVELKWARRCLCAFVLLVVLVAAGAVAAWLVLRR